jgi:hypothetical protein
MERSGSVYIKTKANPKKKKEAKKLDDLVKKSSRELFRMSTVFPFDLFPNTITVDEEKVNIIYRYFFNLEKNIFSILIKNITGVYIRNFWFLTAMTFEVTGYETNPEPVRFLYTRDAIRARRIILGLVACEKEKVDISKIPTDELVAKAEEIGKANENPNV